MKKAIGSQDEGSSSSSDSSSDSDSSSVDSAFGFTPEPVVAGPKSMRLRQKTAGVKAATKAAAAPKKEAALAASSSSSSQAGPGTGVKQRKNAAGGGTKASECFELLQRANVTLEQMGHLDAPNLWKGLLKEKEVDNRMSRANACAQELDQAGLGGGPEAVQFLELASRIKASVELAEHSRKLFEDVRGSSLAQELCSLVFCKEMSDTAERWDSSLFSSVLLHIGHRIAEAILRLLVVTVVNFCWDL